jgi:hypothetical protein
MREIAIEDVPEFQKLFLEKMRSEHRADVLEPLGKGKIDGVITATLEKIAAETVKVIKEAKA